MVKFTAKEEAFLRSNEVCRLATASKEGKPQVTPVIYALDGTSFVIAVDYGTKKLKNVRENPSVARGGQAPADKGGDGGGDVQGAREGC